MLFHTFNFSTDTVQLGPQDLGWFLTNLSGIAPKWFSFGLKLNLQYSRLKIIEKDNPLDCVACLREALASWLSQNATDGQLLKALREEKEIKLLRHIQQGLSQGGHRKG